LTPNILACRSTKALDENVKGKLAQFCHVPAENIVTLYDVPNIWHIPLLLRDQKAHEAILKGLNLLGFVFLTHSFLLCNLFLASFAALALSFYGIKLCQQCLCFCKRLLFFLWPINVSIFFSVAREPELKEWTVRTNIYDTLHNPVGLNHLIYVLGLIY
jgi:hypothetical protein